MQIPIKNAKIRVGSSGKDPTYVITIPAAYVKNGQLQAGQLVDVFLETAVQNPGVERKVEMASVTTPRGGFRFNPKAKNPQMLWLGYYPGFSKESAVKGKSEGLGQTLVKTLVDPRTGLSMEIYMDITSNTPDVHMP